MEPTELASVNYLGKGATGNCTKVQTSALAGVRGSFFGYCIPSMIKAPS